MRISKRRVTKMTVGVGDGCGALDNDNGRRLISKKNNKQRRNLGGCRRLLYEMVI